MLTVGKERVGLSTCLFPKGDPRFFLIPLSHGGLSLEPGARFSIEIGMPKMAVKEGLKVSEV